MAMRRIRSGPLTTLLMSLVLVIGLASSSLAAVGKYGGYSYDGVNIRMYPRLDSTVMGLGYTSHTSCNVFFEQGDPVNGDPWWLWHGNLTTSVQGYSHESFMYYNLPYTQCVF